MFLGVHASSYTLLTTIGNSMEVIKAEDKTL